MSVVPHSALAMLLLQVAVILGVSRLFGMVFRYFGQPLVVAEIVAGIALGPSLLGALSPTLMGDLFPPSSLVGLEAVSQLGLVLFMFVIGLEFDLGLLRNRGRLAVVIAQLSIAVPFALGVGLALALHPIFAPTDVSFTAFALFIGASLSVTAFPVLARILSERGLLATRLGALTLTCAAANDLIAWCMLAFVIAVVRTGGLMEAVRTSVLALGFVAVMLLLVRPFLERVAERFGTTRGLTQTAIAAIVLLLLCAALAAEAIGIHALFGAFLFGAIVPRRDKTVRVLVERFEDVVVVIFLPLFFAFTGLRTSIGLVDTPELWTWCVIIIAVASAGKLLGSAVPARLGGLSLRDSATLGVLMNTRGLMELIILNIGMDLGVLSPVLFTMLVLMAVATTFITTPLVRLLYPPERVLADRIEPVASGGVLAAVAHPDSAPGIARILAVLSAGGRTPAWALRVIDIEQRASLFPEANRSPEASEDDASRAVALEAERLGFHVEPISFAASDPPQAILDVARIRGAEVILLGLHKPLLGSARLGGPLLQIAQRAECDVCMLHDQGGGAVRRVLLALGSPQDDAARRVAQRLGAGPDVAVTTLDVRERMDRVGAVLAAAPAYDLVVLGAGAEWELPMIAVDIRSSRLLAALPCSLLVCRGPQAG